DLCHCLSHFDTCAAASNAKVNLLKTQVISLFGMESSNWLSILAEFNTGFFLMIGAPFFPMMAETFFHFGVGGLF
ncbi:hypothetical protein BDC45DRAFT_444931, partial [Circinella umbellata]